MRFLSNDIPSEQLQHLNDTVKVLSDHPWLAEDVTLYIRDDKVVFCSKKGFRFRRIEESVVQTVSTELYTPNNCLCSVFSLSDATPDIVQKLMNSLSEKHGVKLVNTIDSVLVSYEGDTLMLLNLPSGILRHMMAPSGGLMRTYFGGVVSDLRKIPMLLNYGNLPDTDNHYAGCLTTEYKAGGLDSVTAFHYNLVREVVANPGLGISLSRIATWDA